MDEKLRLARIVTGAHRPHQVVLLVFATIAGAAYAFRQAPEPKSFDNLISPMLLGVWYTLLLAGGVVGLVGSFWKRNVYRGLLLERASMVMLVSALTLYATAAFVVAGSGALGAGGSLAAWAVSCVWRGVQITRDLYVLRQFRMPTRGSRWTSTQS